MHRSGANDLPGSVRNHRKKAYCVHNGLNTTITNSSLFHSSLTLHGHKHCSCNCNHSVILTYSQLLHYVVCAANIACFCVHTPLSVCYREQGRSTNTPLLFRHQRDVCCVIRMVLIVWKVGSSPTHRCDRSLPFIRTRFQWDQLWEQHWRLPR